MERPEPFQDEQHRWVTPLSHSMGLAFVGVEAAGGLRDGDIVCLPGDDPTLVRDHEWTRLVTKHRPTIWHDRMGTDLPDSAARFAPFVVIHR